MVNQYLLLLNQEWNSAVWQNSKITWKEDLSLFWNVLYTYTFTKQMNNCFLGWFTKQTKENLTFLKLKKILFKLTTWLKTS